MGDDSLICEPEESNERDKYAVAIVFDDCKLRFKFLQCLCCCYWQEGEQKSWSWP